MKAFCSIILVVLFSSMQANATIILTNGSVIFDSSNNLTEFKFTLTSDNVLDSMQTMVFDGDGNGNWDIAVASEVFESAPWTLSSLEQIGFLVGALDSPITFDIVTSVDFRFVFVGALNVIGNPWQLSAGFIGSSNDTSALNNVDIATGVAGNVAISSVPEPSTLAILALGMIGLVTRRCKN